MPYSEFTLKKVRQDFNLTIVEQPGFLPTIEPILPSANLAEFLERYLPLALALNTEKARSEMLICPILLEVKRILDEKISLFSGSDFTVDSSVGLNGVCDFLISRSVEQLYIEAPVLIVVEAKREDLNGGLGQCVAEMIAAQRFNEQNQKSVPVIHGTVTTGDRWKFVKLEGQTVTIGLREYLIPPVEQILGILVNLVHG
jgi:co-chaperonin GroES (HSP10)